MDEKWKGQTRGGVFGYMFFIYLIRVLGVRSAYFFLYLVVPYFVLFAPGAVRSVLKYSRTILKKGIPGSIFLLFRNFYALGQTLIDKIAINSGKTDRYRFCFEGFGEFTSVMDSGKGVIMIGAHVGNWEIGTPFFKDYGKKMNIVMFDNEHRRIKELLESNAVKTDYRIIPVNQDELTHIFRITQAIGDNEYVCFQGDRFTGKEKCLTAEFMGRKADFPAGPFMLASRLETPVVFYFAMRGKGMEYRFHFTVLRPGLTCREILERYVEELEKTVRRYPEQWFNYYDFWSHE